MNKLPELFAAPLSANSLEATPLCSVVESYLRYYASGNGHTARAKQLDLSHFLGFLKKHHRCEHEENLTVRHWDFSSVQHFIDHLLQNGVAPATVSRRLATIKHMGRTLAERIPGFVNPAREVKPPKAPQPVPKAIPSQEIERIREKAESRVDERDSFVRQRNRTLFNLLLDTGIRADEVRLLKFGQLTEDLEWIEQVRTKGRRYRNVYVTTEMRAELAEYVKKREETLQRFYGKITRTENRALPLFISTYGAVPGKPESFFMGAKTIWRAINELSAATALHPHLLRHSFALDLLNDSNDIRLVSQALGHSDVRITMRYTERQEREMATALEHARERKRRSTR